MIGEFICWAEVHSSWPARNGKPGGEGWDLMLLDDTKPRDCAMLKMYQYRMKDEERALHWGKCEGRKVKLAITEIFNGERAPLFRGKLLGVGKE